MGRSIAFGASVADALTDQEVAEALECAAHWVADVAAKRACAEYAAAIIAKEIAGCFNHAKHDQITVLVMDFLAGASC